MHIGKTLIGQLERDTKMQILKEKPFEIPDYRTGDVVKITVMNSKTEKKEDSWSGLVISKKAPNSINATVKINFAIENVNTTYMAQLYNPMVTNFEILKYGSNKLKKKLPYIPGLDMSAGRL
jgi:ribosomal protein L19